MEKAKLTERIENIVKNEVLTCQSMLVEELLRKEILSYDDIVNLYVDNSEEIEEATEKIDNIKYSDAYSELDTKYMNDELTEKEEEDYNNLNKQIEELESKIEELEQEQEDPQEIFEWWVVSDWLASKLEEYGEPILKSDYETWWGRTCTGQSIKLDYIIEKIVTDSY